MRCAHAACRLRVPAVDQEVSPSMTVAVAVGVPAETAAGEARVAATPDTVRKIVAQGAQVRVQAGAGVQAWFDDAAYAAAGAQITDAAGAWGADVVLKVRAPQAHEIGLLRPGALLIGLLEPHHGAGLDALAQAGVSAIALERIPRISRAQAMDVLSSQAGIAGYRAVIEAAARARRFLPLMMTPAGTAKAARVVVLGVGVAGLQAIATARRLGAQVEAFDVRPETREQVLSLGAKFIDIDVGEAGAGAGGFARELSTQAQQRQQELLADRLAAADVIITTALVPGRAAPVLVRPEVVARMRPGSVIVDLAAAAGGNCPLTQADEVIDHGGVTLVGITNFPSLMATDASTFLARNVFALLELLLHREGEAPPAVVLDCADEIINAALMVQAGQRRDAA